MIEPERTGTALDVGGYCRRVEDYLTRANAGHLVRIVGSGFELVKSWAESGVPLSVVYRGIDLKAERHNEGRSARPLRIEFCVGDVQAVFDHWRRAVGLMAATPVGSDESDATTPTTGDAESEHAPKRKSLGRHIDRAIDRLSRALSRTETPDGLRADCTPLLDALAALRERSSRARGAAREEAEAALAALDRDLAAAARRHTPEGWLQSLRGEAAADLAPFRQRLDPEAWQRSLDATIDRLLRDRLLFR